MRKEFQYRGVFLIPNSNKKVPGILHHKMKSGLVLEVFDLFEPNLQQYSIIQGFIEGIGEITLYKSYMINRSGGHLNIVKYKCLYFLSGDLFSKKNDLKFNEVRLNFLNLDEWYNDRESFNILPAILNNNKTVIEHTFKPHKKITIDDDTTIYVGTSVMGPSLDYVQKEATIKQKCYVTLKYKRKKDFHYLINDILHFYNLCRLFINASCEIQEVKIRNVKVKSSSNIVDVFYDLDEYLENPKETPPFRMLLPYSKIENIFPIIIKKWYEDKNLLQPVINPFFEAYQNYKISTPDRFLHYARAMEAYHREFIKKKEINKNRFLYLYENYSRLFNGKLKIKDKNKFINQILKFRNDFTHSNHINESGSDVYLRMHYYCEAMNLLLTCVLFEYVGISKKEIKKIIFKTHLFDHLKGNIK